MSLLVGLSEDKGNLQKLKIAFQDLDKDHDGKITKEDMQKAEVVSTFGLEGKWLDVLKKIDLDGNGSIDYEEWITASIGHQKFLTTENI